MEIRAGGGVFGLGNPRVRGGLVVPEIRVEGGKKIMPSVGGVWIFSGITHSDSIFGKIVPCQLLRLNFKNKSDFF